MRLTISLAALVLAGFVSNPALAADATKDAVEEIVSTEQQAVASVEAQHADEGKPAAEASTPKTEETAEPEPEKAKMVCKYVKTSTSRLGRKVCSPAGGK
jgi:hypothetical protein